MSSPAIGKDLLGLEELSAAQITLLLDTFVCAATVTDGQIQEILARSDKTEHLYRIRAPFYADCTGDCRLGVEAGAAFRRLERAASRGWSLILASPDRGLSGCCLR